MASVMAQMLDELMGRDRNLAPDDKSRGIRWDDKRVCKYFLCGMCPHELFTNTKADIGNCDKIHDEELKKDFVKASFYERTQVEDDFERMVEQHLREVDKKISRGHNRLKLSREQTDVAQSSMLFGGPNDEKIKMLSERINDLVDQAETLGCEGKVEEAQGITRLCDRLKEERQQLAYQGSRIPSMIDTAMREEKMMEVCDICGAFLIVGDAQSRIDDHLMGKQHMGYAKLRNCLAELRETRIKVKEEREKAKAEAEAERSKRREGRDEKSGDKDRDRSSRDGDDRRGKSRRDDRRRSRSRDRSRRSRSRDRGGRDKERSGSKDRGGKDKERSRSRDRGGSGRDRERKRSRSREDRKKEDVGKSRDGEKSKVKSSRSQSSERKKRSRSRSRDRKKGDRKDRSRSRDRQQDDKKDVKKDREEKEEKRDNGKSEKEDVKEPAVSSSTTAAAPAAKAETESDNEDDSDGNEKPAMAMSSLLSRIRNGEGYPS